MLHFPSPQPGVSRLALFQQGEWTQVWFGNIWVRIQSEKQSHWEWISIPGTSMVAQWIRVCLPMQGKQVWFQGGFHVLRSSYTHAPRLLSLCPRTRYATAEVRVPIACAPQEEKLPQWEARKPHLESSPHLPHLEKSARSYEHPA